MDDLFNVKRKYPDELSYHSSVQETLLTFGIASFLFYHLSCVGVAQSLTSPTTHLFPEHFLPIPEKFVDRLVMAPPVHGPPTRAQQDGYAYSSMSPALATPGRAPTGNVNAPGSATPYGSHMFSSTPSAPLGLGGGGGFGSATPSVTSTAGRGLGTLGTPLRPPSHHNDPWSTLDAPPVREHPRVVFSALGVSESDAEIIEYFADVVKQQQISSGQPETVLDSGSSVGGDYPSAHAGPPVQTSCTLKLDFAQVALMKNNVPGGPAGASRTPSKSKI